MGKSLLDRLKESSTIDMTNTLEDSEVFANTFVAPTSIPMLNVALSGELGGGLTAGITQFAGPSKHFKTLFGMILVKAYLDQFKDAVVLFYDSEFGAGWQYFDNLKIPRNRVLHTPFVDIEELRHDIAVQLKNITRGDRVIIFVDSIGNSASRKEATDAEEGKEKADMTRAKTLKSLFRIITPHLMLKDIPLIAVNHTYKTMEMFSKDVVSGGTGAYYSSQQIFIIGRQQEKEKSDDDKKKVVGYHFIINVEKSRFVQEKKKIPVTITFEKGVNTWSALLEVAEAGGFVTKPKNGRYCRGDSKEQFTEDETNSKAFWEPVLLDPAFQEYVRKEFKLANTNMLNDELTEVDVESEYESAKTAKIDTEPTRKKKADPVPDKNDVKSTKKTARQLRREARLKKKKGK